MIINHNTSQTDDILAKIDKIADELRTAVVGDPVRVTEYDVAQREAQSYKDAGYTGTVPQSVQSWASAKNWTAQQAADDILATSAAWYSALYAIRDARLKAKESVRNATKWADVQSIFTAYQSTINTIKQQVGL